MLTQERVLALFDYDLFTGELIWKRSARGGWNGKRAGAAFKPATSRTSYLRVKIDGKQYLVHRVIWLFVYGAMCEFIDHIDGDGTNNRLENLRSTTIQENIRNVSTKANNTSGEKNVHWEKVLNKWRVSFRITKPGQKARNYYFGNFSDFEEARARARQVREALHGPYANHG